MDEVVIAFAGRCAAANFGWALVLGISVADADSAD